MTSAQLQAFRRETDPVADKVIAAIMKKNDLSQVNTIFRSLTHNQDVQGTSMPPEVNAYFDQTSQLPSWADRNKIKTGQRVFSRYGSEIAMLLLLKSIMETYTCWRGCRVLYETGRLTSKQGSISGITRRLMETLQFVVNVGSTKGMEPKGKGIVTAQKVRLIHATIRYFIPRTLIWNSATHGEPINQEDMAGTLQAFSCRIIQGLAMVGVDLTPSEREGYTHLWRVVGHLMGIREELNPPDYASASRLASAILDHQAGPGIEGKALAKANIQFIEAMIPGNVMDRVPLLLSRHLVGEKFADILDLKVKKNLLEAIGEKLLVSGFIISDKFMDNDILLRKISEKFNILFIQGVMNYYNEGKQQHFYLPPDLKTNWEDRIAASMKAGNMQGQQTILPPIQKKS